MIQIRTYTADLRPRWDEFVRLSKNGTFLHKRAYLEYHADRFKDHSLLFYKEDELLAVLPATCKDTIFSTHAGLTYAGFLSSARMKAAWMLEVFEALLEYLKNAEFKTFIYKPTPHIYHAFPAEEDLYALFRFNFKLKSRQIASVLDMRQRVAPNKGRKADTKKSLQNGLELCAGMDFLADFWSLEQALLADKYDTAPVHTFAEIQLLAEKFPENIQLHTAYFQGLIVAGVLIYKTSEVAHCQYIAASAEGRKLAALDFIFYHLLENIYAKVKYFDFGTSNEEGGAILNEALIQSKESYGGRGVVYDVWEYCI
jgi:hypothetical protein